MNDFIIRLKGWIPIRVRRKPFPIERTYVDKETGKEVTVYRHAHAEGSKQLYIENHEISAGDL